MDMNESELQKVYSHVMSMLYHDSPYAPGKMIIRKNIHKS